MRPDVAGGRRRHVVTGGRQRCRVRRRQPLERSLARLRRGRQSRVFRRSPPVRTVVQELQLPEHRHASPAVADGRVYIGDSTAAAVSTPSPCRNCATEFGGTRISGRAADPGHAQRHTQSSFGRRGSPRMPDRPRFCERRTAAVSGGQRNGLSIGFDRSGGVLWWSGCRSGEVADRGVGGAGVPARLMQGDRARALRVLRSICVDASSAGAGAGAVAVAVVVGRTGGDLAGSGGRRVVAGDRGGGWVAAPSTMSREVAANGGRRRYRACRGGSAAVRRMRRPKPAKLAACARLRAVVEAKLELRWSPQQISGWLVESSPTIRRCACRTRRSICRCSCSPVARCARN